jgi:hypothetical protein
MAPRPQEQESSERLDTLLREYEQTDSRYRRAMTMFLLIFFAVMISILGYFAIKTLPSSSLNPLEVSKGIDTFATDYTELRQSNDELKKKLTEIEASLEKDPGNVEVSRLEARIDALETRSQNIADTIMDDPDRAITTRLIREKQIALDENIKATQAATAALNDRLDNFLMTLVAGPIIAAIVAIIGTKLYSGQGLRQKAPLKKEEKK